LIQSLIKTTYKEIFFITTLKDNKEIAFPLKLLHYIAQLFFINGFLNKTYDEIDSLNFKNELEFCAEYLTIKGFKDIYVLEDEGEYELIYSNYGVLIQNQGVVIHHYDDEPIPATAKPYCYKRSSHKVLSEYLVMELDAFISENVFETCIGIDTSKADFNFA
jgi:hypothetical protein